MLSDKLKKLRLDKGLQQKDVAENIGVSPAMVSHYERGFKYPSRTTLKKIANFFNVSMDYLESNTEINDTYSNTNTVYEQIKNYIHEYEYEAFKKTKNKEDVTELSKFIDILRQLDNRATFEIYTNIDKEMEYVECIIEMTRALYYFRNFFETIVATINYEKVDIDKLEDESTLALNVIEDALNKLTEVNITSDEAVDELSHIQINYNKNIIDLSESKKITPLPKKEEIPEHLKLNAARPRKGTTGEYLQHDEDIMDDPDF